jgi:ubiquinone/menaquinone biosynthesis C-methylase UbiE
MSNLQEITDHQYLTDQYRNASNLNARILLHQRFSTNKYGWHRWIFDQFKLPSHARLLELGCGPGELWCENLKRIPTGWEITLSDFSAGMIQQAQQNLSSPRQFRFEIVNAQAIPFADARFDAVIANHMLYHVPDKPQALSEIRRVLKPDGRFYASTVGERHLCELLDLRTRFDAQFVADISSESFTLENGLAQIAQWFDKVHLYRYEDALVITEVAPLVEYILSTWSQSTHAQRIALTKFVEREMELCGGTLHITKDSGLFEA